MRISQRAEAVYKLLEDWAYRHPRIAEHNQNRREMLVDPEVKKAWNYGNFRMLGAYVGIAFAFNIPIFVVITLFN